MCVGGGEGGGHHYENGNTTATTVLPEMNSLFKSKTHTVCRICTCILL